MATHPDPSHASTVIVGCQNKKAIQFDSSTGEMVQEYCEHLGSVSTVTIVDRGRRIVTTSDDRKVFVWVYGQPSVEKVS